MVVLQYDEREVGLIRIGRREEKESIYTRDVGRNPKAMISNRSVYFNPPVSLSFSQVDISIQTLYSSFERVTFLKNFIVLFIFLDFVCLFVCLFCSFFVLYIYRIVYSKRIRESFSFRHSSCLFGSSLSI